MTTKPGELTVHCTSTYDGFQCVGHIVTHCSLNTSPALALIRQMNSMECSDPNYAEMEREHVRTAGTAHACHTLVTCWSHVCHMLVTCLSHAGHMFATCWSHACHMLITCLPHAGHMSATCWSHVCHMPFTCWSPTCTYVI